MLLAVAGVRPTRGCRDDAGLAHAVLDVSLRIISKSIWNNPGNRGQRLRKTFDAVGWQLYKRLVRRPKTVTLANGVRFRAYPDCVISSALHYADWPEFHELQFCRRHLRPGDWVVDVGANVGHFCLLLADVVGPERLICYEPTPVSWRRLKENFELNGWPVDRVYQAAVGRREGFLDFPDLEHPDTTNAAGLAGDAGRTVKVPLVALDSIVTQLRGGAVGLLKVDVEGYEPEVFAGARQFLACAQPRLVMFESLTGTPADEIVDAFREAGYTLFQLDANGSPDPDRLTAQNLFAVAGTVAGEVLGLRMWTE